MTDKKTSSDMVELNGEDVYPDWENLLQSNGGAQTGKKQSDLDISLEMLVDRKGLSYWQDVFNQMNFPGMDLMEVTRDTQYLNQPLAEHKLFLQKIPEFLKLLSEENVNDLRMAGIAESNIFAMGKGIMPINWTVHLKYPLDYGGKIDFDNMILIQIEPFHEEIHSFLNKQMLSKAGVARPNELYIPVPTGRVYIPMNTVFSGGGGKAAIQIHGNENGGR